MATCTDEPAGGLADDAPPLPAVLLQYTKVPDEPPSEQAPEVPGVGSRVKTKLCPYQRCTWGAACKFLHVKAPSGEPMAKKVRFAEEEDVAPEPSWDDAAVANDAPAAPDAAFAKPADAGEPTQDLADAEAADVEILKDEELPRKLKYCGFYLKGKCFYGENCKFAHPENMKVKDKTNSKIRVICKHFVEKMQDSSKRGCTFGNACRYLHQFDKLHSAPPTESVLTEDIDRAMEDIVGDMIEDDEMTTEEVPANAEHTRLRMELLMKLNPDVPERVRETMNDLGRLAAAANPRVPGEDESLGGLEDELDAAAASIDDAPPSSMFDRPPKGTGFDELDKVLHNLSAVSAVLKEDRPPPPDAPPFPKPIAPPAERAPTLHTAAHSLDAAAQPFRPLSEKSRLAEAQPFVPKQAAAPSAKTSLNTHAIPFVPNSQPETQGTAAAGFGGVDVAAILAAMNSGTGGVSAQSSAASGAQSDSALVDLLTSGGANIPTLLSNLGRDVVISQLLAALQQQQQQVNEAKQLKEQLHLYQSERKQLEEAVKLERTLMQTLLPPSSYAPGVNVPNAGVPNIPPASLPAASFPMPQQNVAVKNALAAAQARRQQQAQTSLRSAGSRGPFNW